MIKRIQPYIFILNYLGALMVIMGILLFIPLIPYFVYGEHGDYERILFAFVIPGIFSIIAGIFIEKKIPVQVPTVREAMLITALAWIIASVIAALPFIFGIHKNFIDAFFEAASGLTTTGITVFTGLDFMPKSILFWRSFIQWIGGLGILTFFLAVTFRGGSAAATLFSAESHKISSGRPVPGIINTIKILWVIYGTFTVACFFLLSFEGLGAFDALNHSLTVISTGGFSTHDASIAFYSNYHYSFLIEYTFIFFMLMGGINFLVHYNVLCGKWRTIYRDFEIRWLWCVLLISTIFVFFDHIWKSTPSTVFQQGTAASTLEQIHDVFRVSLFQVSSLITSTGYITKDINSPFFPALAKQVFLVLMIIGGCVGSTAGGIKLLRVGICVQTLRCEIRKILSPPHSIAPIVIQGKIIDKGEIQRIMALLFSWFFLIILGAGITAIFSDLNSWQAISGMTSALGNMGPFYFSVEKMASLHSIIKLTYALGMIAGRLEILPIFILFYRSTWR